MLLRFGYTHLITIEKDQFTNEKEEKKMMHWLRENKTKYFMIVSGFSYNGKLKKKNVKMNSYYYQKYILTHFFKDKILSLYPNNLHCVKVNQDKAPSYAYKSTDFFFFF